MLANLDYYAEYGEDKWLNENIELPEHGVFVDVGASDGVTRSNTYGLEKAGWTGICIEADPRVAQQLFSNRKQCFLGAVRNYQGITPLYLSAQDSALSRVSGGAEQDQQIFVPCVHLDDVLEQYQIDHIDLLSIDVEGIELEILNDFCGGCYKPEIVIVEYNTAGLPDASEELIQFFADKPYKLIHKTQANLIFQREEQE